MTNHAASHCAKSHITTQKQGKNRLPILHFLCFFIYFCDISHQENGVGLKCSLQQQQELFRNKMGTLLPSVSICVTHAAKTLLTGSAQLCVLLHTPFATCALEPAGWGKPSWSLERRDMPTSAETGTDTSPAGPLGASDTRESTQHTYLTPLFSFAEYMYACGK